MMEVHGSKLNEAGTLESKLLEQVTGGTEEPESRRWEFCPFAKSGLPCEECIYKQDGVCSIEKQWA